MATTRFVVRRSIEAPLDTVFSFWTEPEHLSRWFYFAPGWTNVEAVVQLTVGGDYRLAMRSPDGVLFEIGGQFLEIDPPRRLAYTWRSMFGNETDSGETTVTVEFHADGDNTEVVITHDAFADANIAGLHENGWRGTLDQLAKAIGE